MRKLFAALLLTSLALPSVYGQANSAPPPRPLRARAETPVPEKAEKPAAKRSLLQRIFGPRPTPTPVPTPAPVVKRTPRYKPRPAPGTPTEAVTKVAPKVPPTTPVTPATTVKPRTVKGSTKKGTSAVALNAGDDAARFKVAKAQAMEDAQIKDLKSKADGEVNEAEAHKALLNYNRALFQKIREVDPSVSDYSGKVEQSMTKRLGAEKAKE